MLYRRRRPLKGLANGRRRRISIRQGLKCRDVGVKWKAGKGGCRERESSRGKVDGIVLCLDRVEPGWQLGRCQLLFKMSTDPEAAIVLVSMSLPSETEMTE